MQVDLVPGGLGGERARWLIVQDRGRNASKSDHVSCRHGTAEGTPPNLTVCHVATAQVDLVPGRLGSGGADRSDRPESRLELLLHHASCLVSIFKFFAVWGSSRAVVCVPVVHVSLWDREVDNAL